MRKEKITNEILHRRVGPTRCDRTVGVLRKLNTDSTRLSQTFNQLKRRQWTLAVTCYRPAVVLLQKTLRCSRYNCQAVASKVK